MKIDPFKIVLFALIAVLFAIPYFIFSLRAPVVVVSDELFIQFYGAQMLRREEVRASLSFFRPVKTVAVADDAGDDIVPFAVDEVSVKPYCVLFPLRFARSARLYHEHRPQVPAVILEGRYGKNAAPSSYAIGTDREGYYIYKTDIDADFYKLGRIALGLNREQDGRIAVFLESAIQTEAREALMRALDNHNLPPETRFFTSFSQFNVTEDFICVILAGIGSEIMEKKLEEPIIMYSWLDPALIPEDVIIVIDDSPWVQAPRAVKMVKAGEAEGRIGSKFRLQKNKFFSRETLQKILKKV